MLITSGVIMKQFNIKKDYHLGKMMAEKLKNNDEAEFQNLVNRVAIYDELIRTCKDNPLNTLEQLKKRESSLKLLRPWDFSKQYDETKMLEQHYRHWFYRVLTVYYNDNIPEKKKPIVLAKAYGTSILPWQRKIIIKYCSDAIKEVENGFENIEVYNRFKI